MTTAERLVDKAKEAFVMAIEIYNKPSIRYRLEGFSFFICNAWELMLKAHLIDKAGEDAVYYPDKPGRTISLDNCIQKIFTNEKAPLRQNLQKIIELRNTSTHFITEEYEMVYIPLLQACVFNFVDKMKEFHGIDMTEVIPENFITLSVRIKALSETVIRAKYSEQVSERLLTTQKALEPMIDENNSAFAIRVEHYHYQTKDKDKATEVYHIEKEAKEGVRIIKEIKNPNETHKYSAKKCIEEIRKHLQRRGIVPLCQGAPVVFNNYHFGLFCSYFGLKADERYCFTYHVQTQTTYSYSQQMIDFIVEEIRKDPEHIIDTLKEAKKKANPGSKGF